MPTHFVQDGVKRRTSGSFFRGDQANFHPTAGSLVRDDALTTYVLKGWMPPEPFLTPETPIVAFGSCFAENISKYLVARGFNVISKSANDSYVTQLGDGFVNTFAIRQQFEWAWLGKAPSSAVWHDQEAAAVAADERIRLATRDLFDRADLFVITLGLSEVWYDEPTGEVFWRAVPKEHYDPSRHKFRVSTVAENRDNLTAIIALIRRFRPAANIVITLSPIPLRATFRPQSCLTANSVSKAVLRAAIDEVLGPLRKTDSRLHYFPSYEIVTTLFDHPWLEDRRHVRSDILDLNMAVFERYFTNSAMTDQDLLRRYRTCHATDRAIGGHLSEIPIEGAGKLNEARKARAKRFADRRLGAEAESSAGGGALGAITALPGLLADATRRLGARARRVIGMGG